MNFAESGSSVIAGLSYNTQYDHSKLEASQKKIASEMPVPHSLGKYF